MSIPHETLAPRRARASDPSPTPRPARPEPRRPPLQVVRPDEARSRPRLRSRLVAAGAVLTALGTVFGLVLVHVELTADELSLTTLQARADQARAANLELRLQVSELESPERIVARAQQLGMVFPPSITYLTAPAGSGPASGPGPGGAPAGPAGVQGWAAMKRVATGP